MDASYASAAQGPSVGAERRSVQSDRCGRPGAEVRLHIHASPLATPVGAGISAYLGAAFKPALQPSDTGPVRIFTLDKDYDRQRLRPPRGSARSSLAQPSSSWSGSGTPFPPSSGCGALRTLNRSSGEDIRIRPLVDLIVQQAKARHPHGWTAGAVTECRCGFRLGRARCREMGG